MTVACAWSSSAAIGLPTMSLRPEDDGVLPFDRARRASRGDASRRPACTAPAPGGPRWSCRRSMGWKPSTSFSGRDGVDDLPRIDLVREGELDEDAVDASRRRSGGRLRRGARLHPLSLETRARASNRSPSSAPWKEMIEGRRRSRREPTYKYADTRQRFPQIALLRLADGVSKTLTSQPSTLPICNPTLICFGFGQGQAGGVVWRFELGSQNDRSLLCS